MSKSPEQCIFDGMYKASIELGYATYDYRPPDEVPYPFVEISEAQTVNQANKSRIFGSVPITINVWGLHKKRRQVSDMALALFDAALKITEIEPFAFSLNINACNTRMLRDNTTNTPLWRAVVELEFKFN